MRYTMVVRILEALVVQRKFIQSVFIFYRSVEVEKLRVYARIAVRAHTAQLA